MSFFKNFGTGGRKKKESGRPALQVHQEQNHRPSGSSAAAPAPAQPAQTQQMRDQLRRNKQQSEESSRSQPMRGPSGSKNNSNSDTKQRTHPEPSGASGAQRAARQPSGEARRYNENGEYRPTEEEEAMLSHLPISANKKERNMSISRSGRHKIRRSRSSVMEEQVYSSGGTNGAGFGPSGWSVSPTSAAV